MPDEEILSGNTWTDAAINGSYRYTVYLERPNILLVFNFDLVDFFIT